MLAERTDVLVIGAGAAGLAAARSLSAAGLTVSLLEARDRIGGRICTQHLKSLPIPIECGAEFVHGKPPETWEIIEAAGLTVCEVAETHWLVENGTIVQCKDYPSEVASIINRLNRQADEPGLHDQSFQQFLNERCEDASEHARSLATAFVEGFNAAPADCISTQWLAESGRASEKIEGDKIFRILNGYDSVIEWLRAGLDPHLVTLRLNTVVTEIDWRRGRVEVKAQSSTGHPFPTFIASRAIVTLSLGVLQAPDDAPGAIRFDPDLREKREAVGRLAMGQVIRIVLCFCDRFWEKGQLPLNQKCGDLSQLTFLHSPSEPFPTWWTAMPVKAAVLTGWAGGRVAESLSHLPESLVLERAVESLAHLFGLSRADVEGQLRNWFVHDWQSDPFARGAYSYVPVGALDAPVILARPVDDTLFFAGEATNTDGHSGMVHGAIATGRRAADEVLSSVIV
jgi:monoamine oxidase